jgi:hypothetical protein
MIAINKKILQDAVIAGIQLALIQDRRFWPTRSPRRSVFLGQGDYGAAWVEFIPRSVFTEPFARVAFIDGSIWQADLIGGGNKVSRVHKENCQWSAHHHAPQT